MELAAAKMIGAGSGSDSFGWSWSRYGNNIWQLFISSYKKSFGSSKTISYFIIRICSYRGYRFIRFSYRSLNTFCILIIKINKLIIFKQ